MLLEATPGSVALRASVVISARSRPFRFLVHLVERLRLVPLPPWRDYRTQLIDGRDVLAFLVNAATAPGVAGESLDIAGPDVLTWGEVMDRWLAYGARLQPHFGHRLALLIDGLGSSGPIRASFRFSNRSIVLVDGRRDYCSGDWQMTVEIGSELQAAVVEEGRPAVWAAERAREPSHPLERLIEL